MNAKLQQLQRQMPLLFDTSCAMLMLMFIFILATAPTATTGDSVSASREHRSVLGTRSAAPADWSIHQRAQSSEIVNFFIALKQQNLDVLESKFWSVSNPKSPDYRQFLSIEEINAIIAPQPKLVSKVKKWLVLNGVADSHITTFSDTLEVHTSVAVAERLFQTEFYEFYRGTWEHSVIKQYGSYSVPAYIRPLIDMVMGIANFPLHRLNPGRQQKSAGSASGPSTSASEYAVSPQTVYGSYGIPAQTQQNASSITSQGIIEFDGECLDQADLKVYSSLTGIPITPITPDHIIGNNTGCHTAHTFAGLATEYIATVNIEAMTWYWVEDMNVWLYGFTTHFYNTANVPQVISIGVNYWEGDQCSSMVSNECAALKLTAEEYVTRMNIEFQKIGLRGVTIVTSSGNEGAHAGDAFCESSQLQVSFPSSSPFVTSVGGTQFLNAKPLDPQPKICGVANMSCAATGTEVALSMTSGPDSIVTGGGFSQWLAMPDYQMNAVSEYLNSGVKLPPARMYNTSNRAHPDISSIAKNALIYNGNPYDIVGPGTGTDVAAPIIAAVIALLNQASIANSGKPLGFLNPLLYQIGADNPSAFHDITIGDNKCASMGCDVTCEGFYTAKGWDPVTGLGTPNYPELLKEIIKLGSGIRRNDATEIAELQ